MTRAILIDRTGGPEVLRPGEITLKPPGPGQVRVRHTAIALNFSDVNVRRGGFYIAKPLEFPVVLGNEAAGVVAEIGPGVEGVRVGERIAYVGVGGPFYENTGSYAEERNVPVKSLIRLNDRITDDQAAAMLMKGLTASSIVKKICPPKPGDWILVHAAASGVGLLLVQWAKHLGARVIGTVGSAEKAHFVRDHGCDHAILYRETDFVAEVRKIVPEGVSAVFDGVGQDTFMPSLDCVRPFGMLVNYGNASGHVPPLDLLLLAKKGSLSVSRPAVSAYQADPEVLAAACDELFRLVAEGVLKVEISRRYKLEDAATAHRDLEAHVHAGTAVLVP